MGTDGDVVSLVLREPSLEDVMELGDVHVAAWRSAYRGSMPDDYLDALRAEDRAEWWAEVLSGPRRDRDVRCVAEVDGRVRGFVLAGPAGGDVAADVGEVFALTVHPDSWRDGVGSTLLTAAESGLREAGFERAVLWVVPGNIRARRFYERGGWRDDGAHRVEQVHGVAIEEVRYRRELPRP